MDVITTHTNADFDSLASMLAAKKLYPEALIAFPGSQEKGVRDFLSTYPLDFKKAKDINLPDIDHLILVDTKHRERIGRFSEIIGRPGLRIHIYDHHPFIESDIRGEVEVVEEIGATATLLTEMLKQRAIAITPLEATILALGIYEETGSLTFASTTERDVLCVAWLIRHGANLNIVASFIGRELSKDEIELLNDLIQSSRDYVIQGIRVKIAKASRDSYMGEISILAHKLRDIEDLDALFLLVRMEDRIQMIARSRVPELDVGAVAQVFGGGGHPTASSAILKDISLEEIEERLISVVNEKVRPLKTAKDIMTTPVKTIGLNTTIKEAQDIMTMYGVNVLPVLKGEAFWGLISREVVEKALFHGFASNSVSEFSTTDAMTALPDTPIMDVEAMMIEQNQRFMPVLEGDRIIGAITRTDLLRNIYEDMLRKSRIEGEPLREKPSVGRNIANLLKERFPEEIFDMLKTAGEVADSLGFSAYIVGGSVRDLLRGEANLDIDIVVEGDAISIAHALGERIGARVKSHQRFGTAVLITDRLKLDIATARTEYYESPGALPRVEVSSIKKDLYRRDFTINTLAVRLNPKDFGQLMDFFGGQRDIREKTLSVLHNLSFIEDPTRAFRAIRFSERFGFKISKHTANLIKTAVRMNLFDKLSGSRLYDELVLIFNETAPGSAIKRLAEFDLVRVIHPKLTYTKSTEEKLKSIQDTLTWFNLLFLEERPDMGILYTMAMLEPLKDEECMEALKRLDVPERVSERLVSGLRQIKEVLRRLSGKGPVEIYYLLKPLSLETLLLCMAKTKDKSQKKAIALYILEMRKTKTSLTGKDLKAIGYEPGPIYTRILKEILDARLEGKIKTRDDEIQYVKSHYTRQLGQG